MLAGLKSSEAVAMLGVEVIGLSILSIKATPEMAKAFQADAREKLLQRADEAIYARRNTAVELERRIKENELNTEIAVEEKKRTVRETKMRADIAVEQERAELVDRRVENQRKESQARADGLRAMLEPMKDVDWRTLMAAQSGGLDSRQLIAMAFRDLADKAESIGNLNISPELLTTLLLDQRRMTATSPSDEPKIRRRRRNRGKKQAIGLYVFAIARIASAADSIVTSSNSRVPMRQSLPIIAVVTRETRLEGLKARWATASAAAFRLQQAVDHEVEVRRNAQGEGWESALISAESTLC